MDLIKKKSNKIKIYTKKKIFIINLQIIIVLNCPKHIYTKKKKKKKNKDNNN